MTIRMNISLQKCKRVILPFSLLSYIGVLMLHLQPHSLKLCPASHLTISKSSSKVNADHFNPTNSENKIFFILILLIHYLLNLEPPSSTALDLFTVNYTESISDFNKYPFLSPATISLNSFSPLQILKQLGK